MAQKNLIVAARTARARNGYRRSLDRDTAREHERSMMYGALDWSEGKDTEWSREYAAVLDRVGRSQAAARAAGDLLNLSGHTAPSKGQRKAQRRARRKSSRVESESYQDGDGIWRSAEVRGFSMRGLEQQQQAGAHDFARDWELSLRGLRCRGFEPVVPSSAKSDGPALARVEAQERLRRLEEALKPVEGGWLLLELVVIRGVGVAAITRAGGPQHVVVTDNIKRVLDIVAEFYGRRGRRRNALLRACASIIADMEREVSA